LNLQILQKSTTIFSFEYAKVYIIFLDSVTKKITMAKHDKVMIFENVGGVNEDFCGLIDNLTTNLSDV
jgi:hypothetical protein